MSEQQQEYGGIIINGIDCSGGGGSSVTPNPPAPATETLSSLDINGVVYGIEQQETRENIFNIFDTINVNSNCSSGTLTLDAYVFGIDDARDDWSGSTTIYNNNAYDLSDIDTLELVVDVTEQSDYAYLWVTFSPTKYTWGGGSWVSTYQNVDSAIQVSQSGSYEIDVSELTGSYYIYIGATSGKDSVTKGDCNNSHNGVISGTVTEFNILSKSSGGTEVIPNPSGSATDTLKKIKINSDIYEVADVEDVTEEEYSALPSTKNSDNIVYMVKYIEDIFDGGSTISLLGTNGITLEESDVDGKVGTLSAYEYSAGHEGFNIALKNLTAGNTYKLEFDFQFTNAQFIGTDYRCAYMMSSTQKTNYSDYTQWTENIPRDLLKHHHSVSFTASSTTMYIAFNLDGCSDNVNNYFTISNIYVIDNEAQNKIIYNGNQYGSSAGGGSSVIANPSGTATATLNKVKIDNIIYQISTSGGGGGFASTTLYTGSQFENTITLDDDYTNYDYLVLQGYNTAENGYLTSGLISVDDITFGNYIGITDDISYLWYTVSDTDTFTIKSHGGSSYYIKSIHGLKESEGGSGTEVEANPEDTPTDTLSTIRIDDTVYNIAGGSGGEGTTTDVLFSKTPDNIHEPTITLSNSLFDYDMITIDYVYVGNNIPYHIGHSYMTDDLNIGDNIGFESGGGNTWYNISNNTTLTLAQSQTAWCVVSIIGTKYGSGGSGGDVVIEYAEYAQFGGTQLVLPFTLNSDYTVEVDYQCLSYFNDQHVIGTSSGGGDRLHVTQYNSRWYYSKGTSEGNFEGTLTDRHVFTINDTNNKILFDGVVKDTYTPTTDNNLKLVIGGRNGGNYQGKIYNYKITSISQNKDLLNLVPARIKIGNVVIKEGLYDTIEGSVYTCNGMTIGGNGGGSTVIGTYIEPNPEEEPTETLENIKINDTVYSIGGEIPEIPIYKYYLKNGNYEDEIGGDTYILTNQAQTTYNQIVDSYIQFTSTSSTYNCLTFASSKTIPKTMKKLIVEYVIEGVQSGEHDGFVIGLRANNSDWVGYYGSYPTYGMTSWDDVIKTTGSGTYELDLTAYNLNETNMYFIIGSNGVSAKITNIYFDTGETQKEIEPNPEGESTDNLEKIRIEDVIYQITSCKEKTTAAYYAIPEETRNTDNVLYAITDDGIHLGDTFNPVIYSTEEREIGVWTDNKPLYQKTFNGAWQLNGTSWSGTIVNIPNAELKNTECLDSDWQSMGVNGNIDSNGNLTLYNLRSVTLTARAVTIQYTKTTDVAGSGSYNTLGVPTVHYTTDEQVIGTWIDGKPLYRKTVIKSGTISQRETISLGIANVENIFLVSDASNVNNGGTPLPYVIGTDNSNNIGGYFDIQQSDTSFLFRIGSGMVGNVENAIITVQYTKTTD